METVLILRKTYDKMIEQNPKFMSTEYLKLKRKWALSGVFVSGDVSRIKQIMSEALTVQN